MVIVALPDLGKIAVGQIAQLEFGVLVEAAGDHLAVPGDGGTIPDFFAIPRIASFQAVFPVHLVIAPEAGILGEGLLGILEVVNLGRFKDYPVHPQFFAEFLDGIHLVFVMGHHNELQVGQGVFFPQFPAGLDELADAADHPREMACLAVHFIGLLGGAVDGEDQAAQFAGRQLPGKLRIGQPGAVGADHREDLLFVGIIDHVDDRRIDERLSLEKKQQHPGVFADLIDDPAVVIDRHIALRA